jgi:glycosyltransferase involved in cell wall biosynthesis
MNKLSIITINYNNKDGLYKTISSVINQTFIDFEYIIIDGGSTDGSIDIIKKHEHNISYWISEPDNGIYNAMNKGIKAANSEYLLFLNSGDHFFNNNVLIENIKHLQFYELVCFNLMEIGEKPNIISLPNTFRFSDLYLGSLLHPSTFIRKDLFEKVGLYDESLKIVSDWKFFILALFIHNCSYLRIDKTLSVFYLDGISSSGAENSEERNKVLKEYFSGFILDYEEWYYNRNFMKLNRFKMLCEIEKLSLVRKTISIIFILCIKLFSKKKLKEILT